MKKSGWALVVVLIVLVAVAWIVQLSQTVLTGVEYRGHLQQAEQYSEKELYQKAIASCDSALQLKDTRKAREQWLTAYKNAYEDNTIEVSDYADALVEMCELYPDEPQYWEILLTVCLDNGDINDAYEYYMMCMDAKVTSETIKDYENDILYAFKVSRKVYKEYARSAAGEYIVYDGKGWGVVEATGERTQNCDFAYISPYNAECWALFVSDNGQRIMDAESVIQAKIDVQFAKTGAYADGLLPVCGKDGVWKYLDCKTNSYLSGTYEYASNYTDGIAAVCQNGKWKLINMSAEQVGSTTFTDVKIHSGGNYMYDGVMVAAVNGEYGLFDAEGEPISSFKAKDMDVYMGSYVAYADQSGKWGYVAKDGDVVMEPEYAYAKSFSNKLAAVSNGESWGFIDTAGNIAIEHQFVDADYFTASGFSLVSSVSGEYYGITLRFWRAR